LIARGVARTLYLMAETPLNPKQQQFVAEYLIDRNATKAAIRAGYSEKTAAQIGFQLLQKTSIREAVEVGTEEAIDRTEVDADWIAKQLQETYHRATAARQFAAANKALELLGKTRGMFPREIHHRGRISLNAPALGGETARKVIEDDRGTKVIDQLFDAFTEGGPQPAASSDCGDQREVRPGPAPAPSQSQAD
jgi:hypothetical protein